MGGAWDEQPYMFAAPDARSPFHRAANCGFRCAKYPQGQRPSLQAFAEATEDPQATYAVAVRYGQGTVGTEPDAKRALSWMRRAAKLGHPMARQFVSKRGRDA